MGYSTDFSGAFSITPTLDEKRATYLKAFSQCRHMKRDVSKIPNKQLVEKARAALNIPIQVLGCGCEGEFCVNESDIFGQTRDPSIIDFNKYPKAVPGLWCQWTITESNDKLVWDEGEKFYNYVDWLVYLVEQFFAPWGYKLNGCVQWQGECTGDCGVIEIEDNEITVFTKWGDLSYASEWNRGFVQRHSLLQ